MIYWIYVVIMVHAIFSVKAALNKRNFVQDSSKCQYASRLTVGNETQLKCCKTVVDNYYENSEPHNRYLSTFLETLQTWNCPDFQHECERRTFDYTEFTSLMYLRFCNRSQMEAQCYNDILGIVTKQSKGNPITITEFNQLVLKLNLTSLSEEDLMNTCVQVAMYDSHSGSQSHYHEIIEPIVPFCSYVWCGFDKSLFERKNVAPWTCMPSRCRLNLALYFVAKICLAFAIVICNATIFGDLSLKKQNIKSIYRMSLAVADFIMGIFVIPINIVTEYMYLVLSPPFISIENNSDYVIVNNSSLPMQPVVVELNHFTNQFSSSYVSAIGFFTVLSFGVSVYSLVAASFDRFVAIAHPLRYNSLKAVFAAKITVVSVWFFGFVLAIFPIVIPNMNYAYVASNLKAFVGEPMLIVYAVAFFLAVILMWSLIIATYSAARPSLKRHDKQCQTDDEMRLVGTLGIMIAVFTLCVLPMALITIASVYLPYIDSLNPTDFDVVAAKQFRFIELSMGLVLASNSLWNCIIYSIRETSFRSARKLLYKRFAQHLKLDQVRNLILQNRSYC